MSTVDQQSYTTAIIIPNGTDLNRGDQALVWEAATFLQESGLAEQVQVIAAAECTGELGSHTAQTAAEGYTILPPILPHPRRGQHQATSRVHDGGHALLRMMWRAFGDFLRYQCLLWCATLPGAACLLSRDTRRTYAAFRQASLVVVKGGGFLHAHGERFAPYYIWYQLFYLRLALRLGKPVIILPNSFGPFEGIGVKRQIRAVLSQCAFIAARESISASALAEILGRPIPVYPDMAYALAGSDQDLALHFCQQAGVPVGKQPCVAFTLRPYRFPNTPDPEQAYADYIAAMAAVVQHVSTRGYYPVLITHVAGPSAHEDDRIALQDLHTQLGDLPHHWIEHPGTCRDIQAVYGCMDVVVGTRFHSVIFAQSRGVPCLAIAYGGNKCLGIMRDMGMEEYVIAIDEVTPERLCELFDTLIENVDSIRIRMRDWQAQQSPLRRAMAQEIQDRLGWRKPA